MTVTKPRPGPGRRTPAAPGGPGSRGGQAAGRDRLAGVARGGALNLAGAAVAAVAALALTVLVTRTFTKPVAGALFTAISLFLIVEAVAGLGANVGAVNFIARLRSLGWEAQIPTILRAAIIPVAVISATAAAALFLGADPIARLLLSAHLGHTGASPTLVADALRALALAVPFAALLDTFLGAGRGYRNMRPTVVVDKVGRSSGQLLGALIAVAAGSAALLAPLWAVPYLPACVAAWFWLRRIRRRAQPRPAGQHPGGPAATDGQPAVARAAPTRDGAPAGGTAADARLADVSPRGFWRFTAPRGLAALAQITIQRIDIVLVAIMRGPAAAAIYTAATRFLVAGQFGNAALNQAAQPRFAELFAVGNRRAAGLVYQATTAWLVLLTWPLYLLAVVYGPEVLTVFGHSYRAGATVMVILGCTMLLATACGQVDMVLITTGRSSWSLANGLMAVVVNVGLDLLLIPRYGITGAAIGWAVAIVVTNLTPLAQLAIAVRLHPFGRGTFLAIGLTALSFGVIPLVVRAAFGRGAVPTVGAVAAGCCVLAAGLWRFRGSLQLSALPGVPRLSRALRVRTGRAVAMQRSSGD
jgi:O-antigen/teichoic acid export membrane protein